MYKLVWKEEFDEDGLLDTNEWEYYSGCPHPEGGELENYMIESINNSFVKDGKLYIRAIKEETEAGEYTSAKVRTKRSWKYGKFEIRAKIPIEKGTWPAIWMLPKGAKEEDWPLCGEIDIMEHVAQNLGQVHFSLHTKKYNWLRENKYTNITQLKEKVYDFNLYTMIWEEDEIRILINNKLCYQERLLEKKTKEVWPFDKEFYLIFSLAVGGWGGLNGLSDKWPQDFIIDYVKIYQKS